MHPYDEPVYLISVVAKVLNIHPQTLRQYEREGLISPSRTEGKTRLYSQKDIDRIKTILRLTRELGVNLAGVDIILRLKEQMQEMEKEIEYLRSELQKYEEGMAVPKNRAVVKKNYNTEIIIFEEKE
ncbi:MULTISPECIES: heat shock protein transcriptional repressor HspR [Nitratiruptor]|uniref:MerR family transcriptional regulator, heat shock protein HspR n=1 Tax=Nitratiruptor tergarcus DSM 16512 TaxID=1069081 RepID=A0A1W1WTM8_9BACT|nr:MULTISPECIES: helix-turn-helix transcriptional regulator [Nitratiruptor]BCD62245.1 MerR family transcriptional regulator, heat shock protein HspR [Nitratiruptor sp. YY08-13]BCD66181.1 MerR family transcriptional regulator, heat shock protein HspR [Nitratiruptor sp. YY08-26]SMC09661.1 MerR family transcriptional regulator, heat shock protein HspR [Nitratiruptor tergarcus DSM 16512]